MDKILRRISKPLIVALAILALGGYETYACVVQGKEPFWHGWQDSSAKKKLDLKIDYAGYYNKPVDGHPNAGFWRPRDLTCQNFFDFDDVKPGDFGEGTISLHLKNQDAWSCAIIRPTRNDDKSSNEPELLESGEARDILSDKWDGELAQNLNFRIWADKCDAGEIHPGDNIYQENCDKLLFEGVAPTDSLKLALADSQNANVFTPNIGPLQKNKTYYVGADWNIPGSVGNIVQTDTYRADITFFAEASEGNTGFRCADIRDQDPEKCVNGVARGCYSGIAGTKDVGVCRAGVETCARGEWGKCDGEVLPEQEICDDGLDNDCDGQKDETGCKPPPCVRNSQCDDRDNKTDDQCVKGECAHKLKNNFWDLCWLKKCR